MRRFALLIVGMMILAWMGCGSSGPSALTFSPPSLSLRPGDSQFITPVATDSHGNVLSTNFAVTWSTSDNTIADVNTNGLVCAGHWDNDGSSIPGNCTPSNCAAPNCAATLTAVIKNGPTGKLTVLVHPPVANLVISQPACISTAGTLFSVTAFSGGVDITSQVWTPASSNIAAVLPFAWSVSNANAASLDTSGATCTTGTTCNITSLASNTPVTVTVTLQSAPGSATTNNVTTSLPTFTCP